MQTLTNDPETGTWESPLPTTMRALTQRRYGTSDIVELDRVATPAIDADQVLIEVHAAAVDRGTEHLMTGRPWLVRLAGFGMFRPKQPVIGLDVSGIVRAVGAEVTRFEVGDAVFGIANGSIAEYAAASESKLAHQPTGVDAEQAAASSVSGITALQALTDVGRLEPGQRVLVIGASGGVGTFAVQLARALGASVVDGIARTDNLDLVTSLGADTVFDHRTTRLADIDAHYDLILDIGGRNSIRSLRRLLAERGTLVMIGGEGGNRVTGGFGRGIRGALLSLVVRHRIALFISAEHHDLIERLGAHLAAGEVTASVGARFPLDEAIEAIRHLESGRSRGKIVVHVRDEG